VLAAAALLVASAVSALGSWQLGERSEVRGVGGTRSQRVFQLDLYEITPLLEVGLEDDSRRSRLAASYAPRLVLTSPTGRFDDVGAVAGYHPLSLAARWRPDPRWALSLAGSRAWGVREISPLSQALAPGAVSDPRDPPPAPPPSSLQPNAGARQASYAATLASASADYHLATRWRLGASAAYSEEGGRNEKARVAFPRQRSAGADLRAAFDLGMRDILTLTASGLRTLHAAGRRSEIGQLAFRWDHAVDRRLAAFLGAGAAVMAAHRPDPLPRHRIESRPVVEFGVRVADPEGHSAPPPDDSRPSEAPATQRTGWSGRGQVRLAPYVDAFSDDVPTRLEARVEADWHAAPLLRFEGSAGSASAVNRSRLGPSIAFLGAGAWSAIARDLELGVTLRAGWQEAAPSPSAPWQWAVGIGLQWSGRRTL